MRAKWDQDGERLYELGTKKGMIYKQVGGAYPKGVAWNGLKAVNESPSGADTTDLWAGDSKYGSLRANEEFGATIEAYTYPDDFAECDGSAEIAKGVTIGQQTRKPFGFSYVSTVGNDQDGIDHGYKIKLVYGATASPSERSYSTINDSPDAVGFSWEVKTVPVAVKNHKPTAILTIDSTKIEPDKLKKIEDILYGTDPTDGSSTDGTDPRLPLPDEIITLISA